MQTDTNVANAHVKPFPKWLRIIVLILLSLNALDILGKSLYILSQFYDHSVVLGLLLTLNPLPWLGLTVAAYSLEWFESVEDVSNPWERYLKALGVFAGALVAPWAAYLFGSFMLTLLASLLVWIGGKIS